MSLLKTTLESPPLIIPFKVRMEPYLVESICDLARLIRDKGPANNDISGLLFGKAEAGVRSIEALKAFADMGSHSELARRQRWEKAYRATVDEAKTDLELSQFEIVGWFSFRTGTGLLSSDLAFHNQHFRKAEDVALIISREGPSQMTAEIYSKSDNDPLTSDDYRWGSVRLSSDIRHMREPIELAMRMKLSDDSYLRTYDTDEPLSHFEILKRRAEAVSDKLFGFLNRGKEEAYNEKVRGLIGDGRLPSRIKPPADGIGNGPAGPINTPTNRIDAVPENGLPNGVSIPKAIVPTEPPATPSSYSKPYSDKPPYFDKPVKRGRPAADKISKTAAPLPPLAPIPSPAPPPAAYIPTPAPPPAMNPWPGSGSGFGTAPARIPEYHSDFGFPEQDPPMLMPSPGVGLELAQIGRSPRTGRAVSNEIGGLPMLLRPPVPTKTSPWPWIVGVFLVCSSLVFGFLALGGLQGENGRLGQMLRTVFPGSGLNLRVRNEDDRLRLSWNQRNHAVASAIDATLQISDGQLNRDIHLDGRQVADGSVLYRPQTSDIIFRMVVRGDQDSATGSVRLLDGLSSRQSTLDVSSPLQNGAIRPSYETPLPDPTAPTLLRDGTIASNETPAVDPFQHSTSPLPATTEAQVPLSPGSTSARSNSSGAPLSGYVPPPGRPAAHTAPRIAAPPRYETPATIGTFQTSDRTPSSNGETAGGSTINGWDSVPATRARNKARTPSSSLPSGYVGPHPLIQVMPNVRNIPVGTLPARTRVSVKVDVDSTGRVIAAHVIGAGINPKVSATAVAAARQWMFDPAKDNGHRISSEHTIVFVLPAR